jgi:hypothetical protein
MCDSSPGLPDGTTLVTIELWMRVVAAEYERCNYIASHDIREKPRDVTASIAWEDRWESYTIALPS